jgi:hypothetical protein
VNAHTSIRPPAFPEAQGQPIDVGAFIRDNGILRIGTFEGNFSVYLAGNKHGTGRTFEEAFDSARGVS